MKNFLLSTALIFSLIASAQEETVKKKSIENKDTESAYLTSKNGLSFTAKDSLFQLKLGFRVQSRAGFQKADGEAGIVEGEIRRMRLKLDGFVYNPKFGYKVELGLSARDMAVAGNNGNIILDGVLFYKPTKNWVIGFGQTKLPGNNQRVISSGALEFTDRTINNSRFNIDRDFGLFLDYSKKHADHFSYNFKGAITKGEGRNYVRALNDGISLTGKIELFPLGVFTKNGNFEGDLLREKSPKLMVSGAFSQNNHAGRSQGQLGNDLFESRTLRYVFLDAMFKYNGWTFLSAYMSRTTNDAITVNPMDSTKKQAVFVGHGVDTQLSYVFPSKYSLAGRYSTQKVNADIQTISPNVDEYAVSLSKYILDHKLKVQTEFSYEKEKFFSGNTAGSWYARVQVEIGI
jgi:phosphate-selective porin OprO/OprP